MKNEFFRHFRAAFPAAKGAPASGDGWQSPGSGRPRDGHRRTLLVAHLMSLR